ncbi:MAG: nuclease-related domain-containing protein [Actinomycetota bacterium]
MTVGYILASVALVFAASVVFREELAWFVAGLSVAAFVPLVRAVFITHEYRRLSEAALAEEFTSSELHALRWGGWKTIDRVQFDRYDVDHVIVGPGGVCVVETKNTNVSWPIEGGRFNDAWALEAVTQVRRNADHIKSLLKQKAGVSLEVETILMVWGDGRPQLSGPADVGRGVTVVTGRLLQDYLRAKPPTLETHEIAEVARALSQFVNDKDLFDQRHLAAT